MILVGVNRRRMVYEDNPNWVLAFPVPLCSSALAVPITSDKLCHWSFSPGAGTYLPFGGPDGFVSAGGTYTNTDLAQSSKGDYTYLRPATPRRLSLSASMGAILLEWRHAGPPASKGPIQAKLGNRKASDIRRMALA